MIFVKTIYIPTEYPLTEAFTIFGQNAEFLRLFAVFLVFFEQDTFEYFIKKAERNEKKLDKHFSILYTDNIEYEKP